MVLTNTLPAGVAVVSASGGGISNAGAVTWPALALLTNGGQTSYTLTIQAPPFGWLTNTFSIGGAGSDPNLANNTVKLVTQVILAPPLMVINAANGIGISGTPGAAFRLEYSTNLTSGAWAPLSTNTLGAGANYVLPWPPTNGAAGFYRAVWLP